MFPAGEERGGEKERETDRKKNWEKKVEMKEHQEGWKSDCRTERGERGQNLKQYIHIYFLNCKMKEDEGRQGRAKSETRQKKMYEGIFSFLFIFFFF